MEGASRDSSAGDPVEDTSWDTAARGPGIEKVLKTISFYVFFEKAAKKYMFS